MFYRLFNCPFQNPSALLKHLYLIPEYKTAGTKMCKLEFNE